MKDVIICLVGASGSGKTTLAVTLGHKGYNVIPSFTTRKPREEGELGHTFVKKEDVPFFKFATQDKEEMIANILLKKEEIIAFQMLYGECYWATREQYKGKGVSIYVVDPKGAMQVKERVTDAIVKIVFLSADLDTRINRLYDRYADTRRITSRLDKDKKIFFAFECDYILDTNGSIDETMVGMTKILEDIEKER